jgi:hypothetical protein
MTLPYENSTSGERAVNDIQKILRSFGCAKFGHMMDYENGILLMQFEYRSTPVTVKASINGYAAAWLKHNPYSTRMHCTRIEHERKAKSIGGTAVYSVLRDWIKGQITAIETGVLTFEGAFLGQIMLPSGKTVLDTAMENNLLPKPEDQKVISITQAKP